jgi:hypothetical protein
LKNAQHREERGDDRAVLCSSRATGKRAVRARGNGERPDAPPAQKSGVCHTHSVSLYSAAGLHSNVERTRQSTEDGATISTSHPINFTNIKEYQKWSARGKTKWEMGPRTVKGLCFGGLFNLYCNWTSTRFKFYHHLREKKRKSDDPPFARQTRSRWQIRASITRCRRRHERSQMGDLIRRAQCRTRRVS